MLSLCEGDSRLREKPCTACFQVGLCSPPLCPTGGCPSRSAKVHSQCLPQQRSSSRQIPLTAGWGGSPFSRCGESLLSVSSPETCCILTWSIVSSFLPYICFRKAYPDVHTSGTQQLPQKLDFRDSGSRARQKTCSWGMRRTHNTRALLCPCSIN